MRLASLTLPAIGVTLALALAAGAAVRAQTAPSRDDIVGKLNHFEEASEVDIAALKPQVMQRAKTRIKNDPGPVNRPLVAPDLASLPAFNAAIQFDADTPIIQPASYQTVGRIADAMVHASLLPYTFLIVGHVESNGRREANVILSQRRADAIRDVLVNTFKISAKRLQSIGLGEEQFLDRARPASAVNGQTQVLIFAKVPDEQPAKPAAAAPAPAKKKPARKH
jgi:outer membrane protein OmpA-like peptidoglycan-associated protein